MKKITPKKLNTKMMAEPMMESYPRFYIDLQTLPEAKNWEVGKTYKVALEIKMTGISTYEDMKDERGDADFNITGIEVLKNKKADPKKKSLPERY